MVFLCHNVKNFTWLRTYKKVWIFKMIEQELKELKVDQKEI